ncbi:hypothetical protein EGN69_17855 [Pseudomonas monteilii]|nr:hypothetical protein EGN69_17855 [Pseudomonas monteilii]
MAKCLRRYHPCFLNGDVTEFGHGSEWGVMFQHLATVPGTYWSLGNHDYQNNVGKCANNGCARDSIQHLEAAVRGWQVDAFHITDEDRPDYRRWTGSYGYSKTIGSIMFIQLNDHYNYTNSFSSNSSPLHPREVRFEITSSLAWLEQQMEVANKNGKYIVINMHRSPGDATFGSAADRNRFYNLVKQYRVLSIFHGHHHNVGVKQPIGDTPVYDAGASFRRGFLTAELDEGEAVWLSMSSPTTTPITPRRPRFPCTCSRPRRHSNSVPSQAVMQSADCLCTKTGRGTFAYRSWKSP